MSRTVTQPAVLLTALILILTSVEGCSTPPSLNTTGTTSSATATVEATPPPVPTRTSVYKPPNTEGPAENVPIPIMPEGVNEPTPEGLKIFAEYWYKTLDYLYKTGETGPYLAVSSAENGTRKVFADNLAQIYADGGWLDGGVAEARTEQVARQSEEDQLYQALVDARYDGIKVHNADGSTLDGGGEAYRALELLTVKYANDAWQVVETRRTGLGEESSFYNRKGAGSPT